MPPDKLVSPPAKDASSALKETLSAVEQTGVVSVVVRYAFADVDHDSVPYQNPGDVFQVNAVVVGQTEVYGEMDVP